MKTIYLGLSVLLLLCLAPMAYGYYQLVRFVAMVVFAILAFNYYKDKKNELSITFGALALLFQPFLKVALGRMIWNVVDVIVAIFLIALYFRNRKEE